MNLYHARVGNNIIIIYVAQEPLSAFRKLDSKVLTFQGTLELVGNFLNSMGTVLDGWELIGNSYHLNSRTWELLFARFLNWELPRIHDPHVGC